MKTQGQLCCEALNLPVTLDSALSYKPEQVMEVYYSAELTKAFFVTLDFQLITNPAYNADRGPINVMGLRLHYEI
jgi:carbohydrate-selective porin OprB